MADVEVARLIAKLEADVRDFDRDLKKAEKRMDKFEGSTRKANKTAGRFDATTRKMKVSLGGMAAAVGAAFAGRAIIDFAKDTVRAASDVEESINAVNVTFGSASEAVLQLSDDAATAVGLSKSQFNSLAVSVSAFATNIANSLGTDVAGVVDDLTTRMADFASVMNVDVQEAATLFRSGLAGETEPLRRFGIDLSAAAVNARALKMGLAGSTSELSEQDKVLARYNLLMEQTNTTAGDFINTSDNLANATRRLQAKWEDAKAELGTAFIPTLEDLIPVLENVIGFAAEAAAEFGLLTGAFTPAQASMMKFRAEVGKQPKGLAALIAVMDDLQGRMQTSNNVGLQSTEVMLEMDNSTGELARGLQELVENIDITHAEFQRLKSGGLDEMLRGLGFLERDIEFIVELLGRKFARGLDEGADKALLLKGGVDSVTGALINLKGPMDDAGEGADDLTTDLGETQTGFVKMRDAAKKAETAIRNMHNRMRGLTDPTFALLDAADRYAESLENLEEVVKDNKSTTKDQEQASRDVLSAYQDLIFAAEEYALVSGVDVMVAIQELGEAAGLSQEQINLVKDALLGIPDTVSSEVVLSYVEENRAALDNFLAINAIDSFTIPVTFDYNDPPPRPPRTFLALPPSLEGVGQRQFGGQVGANQPFVVGERGPELFVPQVSGNIIPNGAGPSVHIEQTFERVEGDNIEEDISLGLLLSGINEFAETS